MKNLEEFNVPIEGEITLCELDGRLQSVTDINIDVSTFTSSLDKYPKINITESLLRHRRHRDESRALFLPTDVPFLKQLTQIYIEQGFKQVLKTAALHNHFLISRSASLLLRLTRYLTKVQQLTNPNLKHNELDLINEFSQTRNWSNVTIKCLSWNNQLLPNTLAVGTIDGSVWIYENTQAPVHLLECKQQKNITCMAWRPLSSEIAVGHENGIVIWNLDFKFVKYIRVYSSVVRYRINHKPVLSLAWSPNGSILASAAAQDSNILIWDVELDKTSVLKGCRDAGNILLKWSPSKDKLLSVSNDLVFKIWDCIHWESDRWTVLSGHVQAAAWTKLGSHLLFASNTEPLIYGLTIRNEQIFTSNSGASIDHAMPLFDVAKIDLGGVSIGGTVKSMETDPKGNYLAVVFEETNFIALFNVITSPLLQLIPSSLISGLTTEAPSVITFQSHFEPGACLTIAWSSGRIQYFPIIYTDLPQNFNASHYVTLNIHSFNSSK